MSLKLEDYIASIPDFPIKGILFRDITPLIQDGEAFNEACDRLAAFGRKVNADFVIGPESRGFLFGAPVAIKMGTGFGLVRKPGKLPRETVSVKYDLEYGSNEISMHKDAIKPGARVLIIDDLLATGGTAKASAQLVEELGGTVAGIGFLIELYGNGMNGRELLKDYDVCSLMELSDN